MNLLLQIVDAGNIITPPAPPDAATFHRRIKDTGYAWHKPVFGLFHRSTLPISPAHLDSCVSLRGHLIFRHADAGQRSHLYFIEDGGGLSRSRKRLTAINIINANDGCFNVNGKMVSWPARPVTFC